MAGQNSPLGVASIKIARLVPQQMTFLGIKVRLNDSFRLGAVTLDPIREELVMSSASWSALVTELNRGGTTPVMDVLEIEVNRAGESMKTTMIDLSMKGPAKVVDRRRVTRYSDDRVDYVCNGIGDLVAQMSNLLSMPRHSEGSVAAVAKRYAELATEMKALREAFTMAEGQFEVAQHQVVQLMGADEQ